MTEWIRYVGSMVLYQPQMYREQNREYNGTDKEA